MSKISQQGTPLSFRCHTPEMIIPPEEASEAILKLASILLNKELLQIHQDKTILCEGRTELDVWYKNKYLGYENNTEEKNQVLNLKLEPFSTSAKQ